MADSMNNAHIFSFFSGIGFLDLGFELNGHEVVYSSEVSADFMSAYHYARKCLNLESPRYGTDSGEDGAIEHLLSTSAKRKLADRIRTSRKSGHVVGFIGGPPCPDFSVGGKNKGRDGDNGKLSASYTTLISEQEPDFFVFENVKGLWSNKKHRSFYEELKNSLLESGYLLSERLINSLEYGVPQDRQRIILVGFHKKFLAACGYQNSLNKLSSQIDIGWDECIRYPKKNIFDQDWPKIDEFSENSTTSCPNKIIKELTAQYWFDKNNVSEHPNSENFFKPRSGIKRFLSVAEGDDSRKSFKRLHRWRYSPTVCYGNNEVHLHPYKVRRLSVAEAMSLQSIPKDFVLPPDMTLTKMFKAIGNGVPYLASKSISETIGNFLMNPKNYCSNISESDQMELFN
jgi:DNA (cytosine-5)-methyltransferase 1